MVRLGFVLVLLGIPGLLLFIVPGLILFVVGGALIAIGMLSNTAKAGAGVGKLAAKAVVHSATRRACVECGSDMPKNAIVCLTCGFRDTAKAQAVASTGPTNWITPGQSDPMPEPSQPASVENESAA